MHYNNFSSCIYVEKIPEQCSLNHHRLQRAREYAWWNMYSSEGLGDLPGISNDKNELQARMKRIRMQKYLREKLLPSH